MRYIKMLSLAAVAAIAAMAFIGASSASAVTLCKVKAEECPTESRYAVGQEIKASLKTGTKAILEAGPITDECSTSTMAGATTANNGSSLLGLITSVTFGGPKGEGCTCPVQQAINLPWEVHLLGEGTMHVLEDAGAEGSGNPGGLVECSTIFGKLHCTYEVEDALVTVTGGNPAIVKASVELPLTGGDGACVFGGNAKWKAEYEVTTPKPLFVSAKP